MADKNKILIILKNHVHDIIDNNDDNIDDNDDDNDVNDDDEYNKYDKYDDKDYIVERKSILKDLKQKKSKVNTVLFSITIDIKDIICLLSLFNILSRSFGVDGFVIRVFAS